MRTSTPFDTWSAGSRVAFMVVTQDGHMTRCMYGECEEAIEATFYLAPGSHESHPWPVSVPYLREPVPLCKWHGLLVGDQPTHEPAEAFRR
jgi:hypothetical protein